MPSACHESRKENRVLGGLASFFERKNENLALQTFQVVSRDTLKAQSLGCVHNWISTCVHR